MVITADFNSREVMFMALENKTTEILNDKVIKFSNSDFLLFRPTKS